MQTPRFRLSLNLTGQSGQLQIMLSSYQILNRQKQKNPELSVRGLSIYGGVDGTRTRDPRRDRPVF